MTPLCFATTGEEGIIKRVSGTSEVKTHLQDLGFVKGTKVKVVSVMNGNLIVHVKETRLGIQAEMAKFIYI